MRFFKHFIVLKYLSRLPRANLRHIFVLVGTGNNFATIQTINMLDARRGIMKLDHEFLQFLSEEARNIQFQVLSPFTCTRSQYFFFVFLKLVLTKIDKLSSSALKSQVTVTNLGFQTFVLSRLIWCTNIYLRIFLKLYFQCMLVFLESMFFD